MFKYPRTHHVEGSRFQPGDEELDGVPYSALAGRWLVIEEKLDGANSGISFSAGGELQLQSRGHYLVGGHRERHFNLLKSWAQAHRQSLWELLGDRYLMFGEWLYAKHTVFYDQLPHFFLEFDLYDRANEEFLDTPSRQKLLQGSPVVSVPVLWQGQAPQRSELEGWVQPALFRSSQAWERLLHSSRDLGLDLQRVAQETDPSPLSEGLYLKLEENGRVVERYKYVRASFLTQVLESQSHWQQRPIVPNQLAPEVVLF